MITIYAIKPYFQKLLKPLVALSIRIGVTPNQITLFTLFLSMGFGVYFTLAGRASFEWMPLVFLARMAFNAVDGMMAVQYQMQSRLGVYLNELGDLISDLFLYLPFVVEFPWAAGCVCALSLLSEVAGILAAAIGEKRRYDGPMGKSDRAFCFSILGFLMAVSWIDEGWVVLCLGVMAFLLCLTIFFRVKRAIVGGR